MRSTLRTCLFFALLLALATAGVAFGEPPAVGPTIKLKPNAALLEAPPKLLAAPSALAQDQRLQRVNASLAAQGLAKIEIPPPPAQMKVTPVAPVVPGGARIVGAASMMFAAPTEEAPEGTWTFWRVQVRLQTRLKDNEMRLEFPTESGKTYLVDCRFSALTRGADLTISFVRGDSSTVQQITSKDGHFVLAVPASGASQRLDLTMADDAFFYGCDITKLN